MWGQGSVDSAQSSRLCGGTTATVGCFSTGSKQCRPVEYEPTRGRGRAASSRLHPRSRLAGSNPPRFAPDYPGAATTARGVTTRTGRQAPGERATRAVPTAMAEVPFAQSAVAAMAPAETMAEVPIPEAIVGAFIGKGGSGHLCRAESALVSPTTLGVCTDGSINDYRFLYLPSQYSNTSCVRKPLS